MKTQYSNKKLTDKISQSTNGKHTPSRRDVWKMFDRIAHRYDLLNRLLSFGQDVVWRNKLAKHLKNKPDQQILDLATGTADVLLSIYKKSNLINKGIGIDLAEKMLDIGTQKIARHNLENKLTLEIGDASEIPYSDNSFDVVSIAFGIRNLTDTEKRLREMYRVLGSGGRALILEFSLPENRFFRSLYLFYFRKILPVFGGVISGDSYAYRYLNQTVETFPFGEDFLKLMKSAGFSDVKATPLTFGIATIYQGDKLE